MATDFVIPKLGENIEQATIVNWLVEDGDEVKEGQDILELETDKATLPVPANASGHIHLGPFQVGDVVAVDQVVATIGQQNDSFAPGGSGADAKPRPKQAPAAEQPAAKKAPAPAETKSAAQPQKTAAGLPESPKATPVAQKIADDLGLDLEAINGSGERGKITKEDVLQAASGEKKAQPAPQAKAAEKDKPAPAAAPQAEPPVKPASFAAAAAEDEVLERVPLKGIRGVIARRMAESVHTTARVTLVTEVDATEFVALREQLKAKFSDEWGFAPGYNDLLAMIVASGLRQFPYMNARLSADGESIERLKPVNLGMAVDTDRGLLVTVIRDADKKGLQELGSEFRQMVQRARAGKSTPDDLSGSTFTITSLGIFRVDAFTPVINLPDAAILGVGRIKDKAVVKDGQIVARKMVTLSLVFDHRLTDGAPAARFLDYICELIEEPYLLFLTKR